MENLGEKPRRKGRRNRFRGGYGCCYTHILVFFTRSNVYLHYIKRNSESWVGTIMVDIQRELLADGKTQYKVVDNDVVYIITTNEEVAMGCYNERKKLEQ